MSHVGDKLRELQRDFIGGPQDSSTIFQIERKPLPIKEILLSMTIRPCNSKRFELLEKSLLFTGWVHAFLIDAIDFQLIHIERNLMESLI